MNAGFYWVRDHKHSETWSVVFIYTDGSWSRVWWANPRQGLIGDLAEIGPKIEPPGGDKHEWPVDPIGYLESLQDSCRKIVQEIGLLRAERRDDWLMSVLCKELHETQEKVSRLTRTIDKRLTP